MPAWPSEEQPQPCLAVHSEGAGHVGSGQLHNQTIIAPDKHIELKIHSGSLMRMQVVHAVHKYQGPRSLSSGPVIFRLLPSLEIRLLNIEGTLWVKISPDLGEM